MQKAGRAEMSFAQGFPILFVRDGLYAVQELAVIIGRIEFSYAS
jgi:hypothetical protein